MGVKGQSGGKKGRSGRKSKAEEMGLQALLDKCFTVADRERLIKSLVSKATHGLESLEAIKLLLAYTYGKPVERKELVGQDGQPIRIIIEHVGNTTEDDQD